jgi:hypothetical protein
MTSWTDDELATLRTAGSLQLEAAPVDQPATGRVEIGVVTFGGAAYLRAYRRTGSTWFQATRAFGRGTIRAGDLERDVVFEAADPASANQIDAAYRSKYGRYGAAAVGFAINPLSRAATVKITPVESARPASPAPPACPGE